MTLRPDRRWHFWSPLNPPDGLEEWDPDTAPYTFANGRGHAFYELYVRFKALGLSVSLGPGMPDEASAVIVFAKDLSARDSLRFLLLASHLPTVLIESDWPRSFRLPIKPSIKVCSTRQGAKGVGEVVLPLLPQRGMIPRRSDRYGTVAALGYKGDPFQAPAFLRSPKFNDDLMELGILFDRSDLEGSASRWHDFAETDVVLCMRDVTLETAHKPPTKLINAWAAGCIALVGPEPAYIELASDQQDALAVVDEESVLSALRALRSSPSLVYALERGGAKKAHEFSREKLLGQWVEVVVAAGDIGERPRLRATSVALARWFVAQFANLTSRLTTWLRPKAVSQP